MSAEAFARAVADLVADLPAGHVAAWAEVLAAARRPDEALEAALGDARPGYAVAGAARRLVAAWRTHAADLPGAAVALALRSAGEVRQRADAHRPTLVVSGPSTASVPVRLTSSVIVEVIRAARERLLVVSFAAYGVAEVVRELAAAADRGVHLDLVLEDAHAPGGAGGKGAAGGLGGGAASAFAALRDRATFWHWPTERRPVAGSSRASLHAKLVAADASVALISSANLTDRALSSNLEVGVVLRDPHVVSRLVAHFAALMAPTASALAPFPVR